MIGRGRISFPAAIGITAVIAAGLRAWAVATLAGDPRVSDPLLDGQLYLEFAARAAEGAWPQGPIFQTPLYPLGLSVLFRAGWGSVLAVQVIQSLLGVVALVPLMLAARRDFGERAAIAAGGLYALAGPVIAIENQVLTESLLLVLAAIALWLQPTAPRRGPRDAARAVLYGLVCGWLAIGRGVFLLLPVLTAGILLSRASRVRGKPTHARSGGAEGDDANPRAAIRRAALSAAWIATGVILGLLPLAAHQSSALGRLQVLTLNGGINLYIGNHPAATGIYARPPEIDLEADFSGARSASILAGREIGLAEADAWWTQRAIERALEEPGRWFGLLGRKALLYFSPAEIPQVENFGILRGLSPALRVAFVDFWWVFPLFVFGIAAGLRRWGAASPWLALVAVGWIATVVFFATGRYRIPFWPGFLGPAGYGLVVLVREIRARRPRRIWIAVPAAVALLVFIPGVSEQRGRAHDATQMGLRLARRGEPARSLEWYSRAAQIEPSSYEARHGVGVALVELGRLPEAARAYEQALRIQPSSAVTHYNLGAVYGMLGRDDLALDRFAAAARLNPYDPRFLSDFGVALARTGRIPEAVAQFRLALARDPGYEPARRHLQTLGVVGG